MSKKQENFRQRATRFISIIPILLIAITSHSQNTAGKDADPHSPFVIENGDTTYLKVDVDPTFPGGDAAWNKFLGKTLQYPMEAISNEIQGIVWVQFAVDKQGNMSELKIVSGPKKGGLREEAIRVMNLSGHWMPAVKDGHQVKAYAKKSFVFKVVH